MHPSVTSVTSSYKEVTEVPVHGSAKWPHREQSGTRFFMADKNGKNGQAPARWDFSTWQRWPNQRDAPANVAINLRSIPDKKARGAANFEALYKKRWAGRNIEGAFNYADL